MCIKDFNYMYYFKLLNYVSFSKLNEDNIQNIIDNQLNDNNKINEFDKIQELKKNNNDYVVYNIPESPKNNTNKINTSNKKYCKYFDIIYSIFIILLITWKLFFIIGYSIYLNDIMYIFRNLYDCGIPIQYYLGKKYFKKNHFRNMLSKAKMFYPKKYNKYINIYLPILILISFLFAIIELVLILVNNNNNTLLYSTIFNNATKYYKPYIIIVFFIGNIYSINIFFLNVFTFSVVFRILSLNILKFYNEIKDKKNNYQPSELCNNIIRLRNEYESSLDKLNLTFSTIVFFGGLSSYVYLIDIKQGTATIFQFIYTFIFIILSFIYFKSILISKKARRDLHSYSYSNELIEKLLSRQKINQIDKLNIKKNSDIRSVILDSENAETLDWLITYQLFGDEWDSFRLLGFTFDDMNLLKKGLVLLVGYYATGKFSQIFKLFN